MTMAKVLKSIERDFNDMGQKPKGGVRVLAPFVSQRQTVSILVGLGCTHSRMRECHPGCGHFECPDCGLTWDEGAGR